MSGTGPPESANTGPAGATKVPRSTVFVVSSWSRGAMKAQGRLPGGYGAQSGAAYAQGVSYQPVQTSSGTEHAGEEKYIAFSEGNDTDELVIQTLSGEFVVKGENHGRPYYQKVPLQAGTPEVYVYYWDGRDGPSFEGWWFGKAVGGKEVWSHCSDKAMLPPLQGWKIPVQGPPRNTFIMMPRSEKVKRENSERAGKVKVLEQGASSVITAAQTAADEAKAICEKDHGSLDPTLLKEVEEWPEEELMAYDPEIEDGNCWQCGRPGAVDRYCWSCWEQYEKDEASRNVLQLLKPKPRRRQTQPCGGGSTVVNECSSSRAEGTLPRP